MYKSLIRIRIRIRIKRDIRALNRSDAPVRPPQPGRDHRDRLGNAIRLLGLDLPAGKRARNPPSRLLRPAIAGRAVPCGFLADPGGETGTGIPGAEGRTDRCGQ